MIELRLLVCFNVLSCFFLFVCLVFSVLMNCYAMTIALNSAV
jgi:hypothetical protein